MRNNYQKNQIIQLRVDLNKKKDKDIIDFLKKIENKSKFIKKIIRANM